MSWQSCTWPGMRADAPAAQCRLAEEQLIQQTIDAVTRLSRDPDPEVKCAACSAAGALAAGEVEGHLPQGSALPALVPTFTALLGPDQFSEVQRQQMQVSIDRRGVQVWTWPWCLLPGCAWLAWQGSMSWDESATSGAGRAW